MLTGTGASTTFAGSISRISLRPGSATRQVKNLSSQVWIFSHTIFTYCLLGRAKSFSYKDSLRNTFAVIVGLLEENLLILKAI